MKKYHTEEQILRILKEAEQGKPLPDVLRTHGNRLNCGERRWLPVSERQSAQIVLVGHCWQGSEPPLRR